MAGCTDTEITSPTQDTIEQTAQQDDSTSKEVTTNKDANQSTEQTADATEDKQAKETTSSTKSTATPASDAFKGYKKIEVDGGDLFGSR